MRRWRTHVQLASAVPLGHAEPKQFGCREVAEELVGRHPMGIRQGAFSSVGGLAHRSDPVKW
jgi:hypothetical protein